MLIFDTCDTGLTGSVSKGPASVEVASFRDCSAPRTDATGAPSKYHTVPITTVQPKQVTLYSVCLLRIERKSVDL